MKKTRRNKHADVGQSDWTMHDVDDVGQSDWSSENQRVLYAPFFFAGFLFRPCDPALLLAVTFGEETRKVLRTLLEGGLHT